MAAPELTTTRYVEVGTYIGQFFTPGTGALPVNRRVPCIVAKGDRLFIVPNTPILRSFRFQEALTFSAISPFIATLDYASNGAQASPVKVYSTDGNLIQSNRWQFIQDGFGNYTQIQIIDTAYNPLAQYVIDYQTTSRDIADPIPLVTIGSLSGVSAQVRSISAVGPFQDQAQYLEYVNFFVPFALDAPIANPGNAFLTSGFSPVTAVSLPGSTGSAIVSVTSYLHPYSRLYTLEVTAVDNTIGARTATLEWVGAPVSAGNASLPRTPIHAALPSPSILIQELVPLSLTNVPLELGVALDFDFGLTNFVVGDLLYVQAEGAGLIEIDPLLTNVNQYTEISAVTPTLQVGSTGSALITSLPSAYSFTGYNTSFRMICESSSLGPKVATFVWVMYGGTTTTGSFTIDETVSGSLVQVLGSTGITLTLAFGATNFVVGDKFDWTVLAPRSFYRGKEDARNISLSIATAVSLANKGTYSGGWLADTAEGGFGVWTADSTVNNGRFEINDGLRFYVRNTYLSSLVNPVPSGSRSLAGDLWILQARSLSFLDFSLKEQTVATFSNPGHISTDVTGAITGTVGAKYISLDHLPSSIISVTRLSDTTSVLYTQVPGTAFLQLTAPFGIVDGDIQVVYLWGGAEPDPGQTYYLTGQYLRPAEMYETPFLFLSVGDARKFLAPSNTRNDLYIGAEIAFDYAIPGLYVIQVRNAADDGIYTKTDYKRAINAFLDQKLASDLVVLNSFQNIGDQLNVVNQANDPFAKHECITYFGAPIGTPIGSEQESNSLVFYSRRTFAVYGQSPAHGSRLLIAATEAKRTITLEDKTSTQIVLDGSFVACAVAALVASFADPKETILFKQLVGFDSIQTYTPQENLILGANNIVFFEDVGEGVVEIKEDITTDPFSADTLNLNQMTQKQYVTRDIRNTLTQAIIGQVFPSAGAGVALIEDILQTRLRNLVSRGFMGQYQDAAGLTRSISGVDIYVVRDVSDPTLFHIGYNYFLATVAKRIFGLFTVSLPGGFPS